MIKVIHTILLSLLVAGQVNFAYAQTASLLPNAKQVFLDSNGKPLVGGKVQFYVPGTTSPKTTWQDSGETIPNTNPVILDGAGRAIILGDGNYRQVVTDRLGNLIWDQATSSTGTGGGGTTATVGDGDAVGTVKPWSGLIAPQAYVFSYGQELARASFPLLFSTITTQQNVGCTSGNATLTGLGDTSQIPMGAPVESICLNAGATVVSTTISTITVSSNAIITTNSSARIFPFGNGDGSTTFNVPDLRGRAVAGRDNMGSVAANRLTSAATGFGKVAALGANGGNQNYVMQLSNLIQHTHANSLTDPGHTHGIFSNTGTATNGTLISSGNPAYINNSLGTASANSTTNVTINNAAAGSATPTAMPTVQPTEILNYIIKTIPDSNPNSFFGVASIGGMTGIITCGTGITCSGNTISAINPAPGAGGANTQVQYNSSGVLSGISGATSDGITLTAISPIVQNIINWNYNSTILGTQSIGDLSVTTPSGSYITTWQGNITGGTTALHILPASGPLSGTVTTSELVIGTTPTQVFGGNYGRWSYSNFASTISGIVGEYGGTVTSPSFDLQIGIENPPSVFTSYGYWNAITVDGGAEDVQVGAIQFGQIQPSPTTQKNRIALIKPYSGTANSTQNSDAILWEGKSNDGTTTRAEWWRQFVNVTSNAGASTFDFQSNLNGLGWNTRASLTDAGLFTAANLTLSGITGSTQCLQVSTSGVVSGSGGACGGSGSTPPAGTSGQVQYNNSGVFGGFTVSGDGALNTSTGAFTLATVNANTGAFGSATQCVTVTNNVKGLTTAVSATACTPAITSITGLGTGVATALAVNIGTAGAVVVNGGALGTPSSGLATNLTGTAAGLTAGNVTTNANLTGAITSSGNATSLGSFTSANLSTALTDETGTGSAVFGTSPVLATVDARGVWTTGTSWTLPAHTLGGIVSGGGNQINNVIIGTVTPLSGFFTTASATTSITSPIHYGGSAAGSTLALTSTSSGAPSGDKITLTTGGVVRGTLLSNGFLGLGTETNPQATLVLSGNAATGLPLAVGTQFGLIAADGTGTTFDVDSYNNGTSTSGGAFAFRTARGTGASPANLVAGDLMGAISGRGYISGNFTNAPARMAFIYNDTSPNLGTYIEFDTTAAGSTSRNQALRLMAGVVIGTGTTDPGLGNLSVGGYVTPSVGFTVSTLPASPAKGSIAYVTDAVTCTFLASLTGGGTTYCPVTYNGSAWIGG